MAYIMGIYQCMVCTSGIMEFDCLHIKKPCKGVHWNLISFYM